MTEDREKIIGQMEAMASVYIDGEVVGRVLELFDVEEELLAQVNDEVGWEEVSTAYKEAQAARKPIRDRLDAAHSKLRGKLLAYLMEGREHDRLTKRKLAPEVVIHDLDKIPRRFLVPDMKQLNHLADALGPEMEIPGVGIKARYSVVIKGAEG